MRCMQCMLRLGSRCEEEEVKPPRRGMQSEGGYHHLVEHQQRRPGRRHDGRRSPTRRVVDQGLLADALAHLHTRTTDG